MPIRFPSAMLPPAPGPARRGAGGKGSFWEGKGGKARPPAKEGGCFWGEKDKWRHKWPWDT